MKWLRKWFSTEDLRQSDAFAEEIRQAMGGLGDRTKEFAEAVQEFGLEQQIEDLKARITALEKAIYPLRNGAPTR